MTCNIVTAGAHSFNGYNCPFQHLVKWSDIELDFFHDHAEISNCSLLFQTEQASTIG